MSNLYSDFYSRIFKNATAFKIRKAGGDYSVVADNPAANRTLGIIDPGADDDFVFADATQTLSNKTLGSNLNAGGNKITNAANGTDANDLVNYSQLQAHTAGLKPLKTAARLATTANITLANEQTIDGVPAVAGDFILAKDQTDKSENGLFVVVDGGPWTRHPDFDGPEDVPEFGLVFLFVAEGDTQANTGWMLTTDAPYTIGTDDLEFAQFNAGTSYIGGDGIDISGNTISAVGVSGYISVGPSGITIDSSYAGQPSIVTVGNIATGTWSADTIALDKGGTGQTTKTAAYDALSPLSALGDLPYGGSAGTGTRLAGNVTTTKKLLSQTGDGVNSAAPTWSVLVSGDIPVIALGTVGSNGGISGTLDIANGGTGQTTPSAALNALGGMPFKLPTRTVVNNDATLVAGVDIALIMNTGSSPRDVDVPTAGSGTLGQIFIIAKSGSGNGVVNAVPSGCTINGESAWPVENLYEALWLLDDGSNYITI